MENIKTLKLKNICDLKQIQNNKNVENSVKSDLSHEKKDFTHIKTPRFTHDQLMSFKPKSIENPLTSDEVKEKRKIIIQIKNYLREFPLALTDFNSIDYNNKNIHELNNYLDEIKISVCNSNSGGLMLGVFHGSCNVLENVAPMVGLDLTGLGEISLKNPSIVSCVKEISLEYQNLNYIPPEKRLALIMMQLCYSLNSANKYNKKLDNSLEKNINENINDKYSDL